MATLPAVNFFCTFNVLIARNVHMHYIRYPSNHMVLIASSSYHSLVRILLMLLY